MCCADCSITPSSLVVDPGAYDRPGPYPGRQINLPGFPVKFCAGCVIADVRFFALTLGHRFEFNSFIHSFIHCLAHFLGRRLGCLVCLRRDSASIL